MNTDKIVSGLQTEERKTIELPSVDLEISDRFPGSREGVTTLKTATIKSQGEFIGFIHFVVNNKRKEMYVTGVDFGDKTGRGFGSAAYIQLGRQFPDLKFMSSGDYVEQEHGTKLGVKLWKKLERLGLAMLVDEDMWQFTDRS